APSGRPTGWPRPSPQPANATRVRCTSGPRSVSSSGSRTEHPPRRRQAASSSARVCSTPTCRWCGTAWGTAAGSQILQRAAGAGKLRAVVCELPADEKAAALARRATAGRGTDGPGARPDTGPSPGPRATEPPLPLISVVIPCRDEEPYIGACLESILGSDYPQERLEVLVADGMSRDQSRDIVARYAVQHPSIRLLDNPQQVTPTGL